MRQKKADESIGGGKYLIWNDIKTRKESWILIKIACMRDEFSKAMIRYIFGHNWRESHKRLKKV